MSNVTKSNVTKDKKKLSTSEQQQEDERLKAILKIMPFLTITPETVYEDSYDNVHKRFQRIAIQTLREKPTYFTHDGLQIIAIAVDGDLYQRVKEIIARYKETKDFGMMDLIKIWKLVKPLIEKELET